MTGSWASKKLFLPTQNVHMLMNVWPGVLFLIVGLGTMSNWAVQKHRKYKKEFGSDYPRNRKIIIPFIF